MNTVECFHACKCNQFLHIHVQIDGNCFYYSHAPTRDRIGIVLNVRIKKNVKKLKNKPKHHKKELYCNLGICTK